MTPSGWLLDDIALLGFAWTFGGIIVCGLLGVLVGRRSSSEAGIGSALLLWGMGNLAVVVMAALLVYLDTVVLVPETVRCEAGTDSRGRPAHTMRHALQRPGEPAHEFEGPRTRGPCPPGSPSPEPLRVRRDALASSTVLLRSEPADDDRPLALMVTWGAFGGFGALAGGLLLAHRRGASRKPVKVHDPASVAPWRRSLSELIAQLGLLALLAALVGPFVIDGSTERALQFGLRSAAAAFGCWLTAGIVGGGLTIGGAGGLALFGAVLLGFAELIRRAG